VRIDPGDKIGGVSVMTVRDLLLRFMGATVVAAYFRDPGLLEVLLAKGLVGTLYRDPTQLREPRVVIGPGDHAVGPWYELTDEGNGFAQASAAAPLKRATAERKLREFMARVEQVNQSEEFAYRVKRVVLFGSYLTDAERVNDIDLAVQLAPRWDGFDVGRQYQKEQERVRLARRHRKRNAFAVEQWPWREVFLFLKGRSRAFSFHGIDDPILRGIPKRVLYPPEEVRS
jgi:predicted nucleotidyltransferase